MLIHRLPAAAVLAACGADDGRGDTTSSPTRTEPQTDLIEYDQDEEAGVTVTKAADLAKLKGAPDDFKQFVAGLIDGFEAPPQDDCRFKVSVTKVDTSGFAAGSMGSCGGAMYIWAEQDGVWQEIWSGQELPVCADMKKYSVPKPIAGDKCYRNENMTDLVDYTG